MLVEAGPTFLNVLIDAGLWDAAREEVSPMALGDEGVCVAPELPASMIEKVEKWGDSTIITYSNTHKKPVPLQPKFD